MRATFSPSKRNLILFFFLGSIIFLLTRSANAGRSPSSDPWSEAQLVQPADLVHELSSTAAKPSILYVGPRALFLGAHIPGATFHGTSSTNAGLDELKKWAATQSRDTNLVIYCGCCPFEKCPNVRPAFSALHEMGFTHVRVLAVATSFKVDWIDKNYPTEKSM